MIVVWLLLAATAVVGGMALWSAWRKARRVRIMKQPFPAAWMAILERNVPVYHHLPIALREQLHGLIHLFLDEKHFEGCGGLTITDEIRLTIAAQACILLLNRPDTSFSSLTSILVYPQAYVAKAAEFTDGLVSERDTVRAGESWTGGAVVLSWDNVRHGARDATDGQNVTLHEFAHQLDQEDGVADGAPILGEGSRYAVWARVLGKDFKRLRRRLEAGKKPFLDAYGATDPAEFFAVATEFFFERPDRMKRRRPELYEELRQYYQVDPADWF